PRPPRPTRAGQLAVKKGQASAEPRGAAGATGLAQGPRGVTASRPRGGWPVGGGVGQDAVMATHVALLRGINVGGNNKVPMAELREVGASLGHTAVSTYIQSGNVLFTAQEGAAADAPALAAGLEQAIEQAFGLRLGEGIVSRADQATCTGVSAH